MKKIALPFYGKFAFSIVNTITGQLSDGIWENSRAMEKYWHNIDFSMDENERIFAEINDSSYCRIRGYNRQVDRFCNNPFFNMTDNEVIVWIAKMLKRIVNVELNDNKITNGWKRNSNYELTYFHNDPKIKQIYAMYDKLLGRTINTNKYEIENLDNVFGVQADAQTVLTNIERNQKQKEYITKKLEIENLKKKAIAELNKKFDNDITELYNNYKQYFYVN